MSNTKKEKISSIKNEVKELHPLLDILLRKLPDVVDVEYTHGTTEFGADFVFSKTDSILKHQKYVAVIAKVGKIHQDLFDVERQIEECSYLRTFQGGAQKIRVDEIWVVSNDNITKGAQEKIFEKYRSTNIEFVTGERLSKLVDDYFPSFWTDTSLQVGEYLSVLRASAEQVDRQLSLVQVGNNGFYIEQDLYEFPRYESRKILKIKNKKPGKVNLFDEIKKRNFILVEGGVGSGKSKLLRHLISYFTMPDVFENAKILPVFTSYKELSEDFQLNFENLINKKLPDKLRSEIVGEKIKYLILIDAFDEKNINIEEQVNEISRILENLRNTTNIKVIVTSRYLSELDRTNILENEITRLNLAPLTMSRTLEFVKALCVNLNLASRLLEDIKKSQLLKEMPRSPIAAILLAKLINENPKDLPSSLSELYAQYIELILGRWEVEKGLETQKEYQALDNILMEYARYIMDYEMPIVPLGDSKDIVKTYLSERNLEINPDYLFEKLITRCEIVAIDPQTGSIGFKHRSFAEFFYAKYLIKSALAFDFESKAFTAYWMNMVFFYLGIQKDAPQLIRKLVSCAPGDESGRWLKIINMSNYMLAAYATPYNVISDAMTNVLLEAGLLFDDVVTKRVDSPFAVLSHMQLLHLMQYLLRGNYSFDFFKGALEESVVRIDDSEASAPIKAYSMYFLNSAYIELGATETFDILLKKYAQDLPLDINLLIHYETKDLKVRSDLMRKQDRKIKHILRDNKPLNHEVKILYESPIKFLPDSNSKEAK